MFKDGWSCMVIVTLVVDRYRYLYIFIDKRWIFCKSFSKILIKNMLVL